MVTVMDPEMGQIDIPEWVVDLDSFCRWRQQDDVPEKLKAHFIDGRVWVDLHMEELFTHNQVKSAIGDSLGGWIRRNRLGMYLPDGMLYRSEAAALGTEPDGTVVLNATWESGRVSSTAGKKSGATATILIGTPDIVIEILSPSSEDKDFEWLMANYHNAGIPEYWLIDARGPTLRFDIHRHRAKGYIVARKSGGWIKSDVLSKSFRLAREYGENEIPYYELFIR